MIKYISANYLIRDAIICGSLIFLSEALFFTISSVKDISFDGLLSAANPIENYFILLAAIPSIVAGISISASFQRSSLQNFGVINIYFILAIFLLIPVFMYLGTAFILSILIIATGAMEMLVGSHANPIILLIIVILFFVTLPASSLFMTVIIVLFSFPVLPKYIPYSSFAIFLYFIYLRFSNEK